MRQFFLRCTIDICMLLVVFYGVGVNVLPLCCLEEHEHLTLGKPHHCHHHCGSEDDESRSQHSLHHHSTDCCKLTRLVLQLSNVKSNSMDFVPEICPGFPPQPHINTLSLFVDNVLTFCFASKAPPLYNGRCQLLHKCCLII